jgi:hypothetical protein
MTMVSTPDGSKLLTERGVLDLNTNTETINAAGLFPPLAINSDANIVSALIETPLGPYGRANFDSHQYEISFLQDRPSIMTNAYSETNGTQLNPSGSLVFEPYLYGPSGLMQPTQGVDISDVHTGHIALRVALSDPISPVFGPMVLDETGSRMFFITSTGITVDQLNEIPLSIASANPASGSPGSVVTIRGSGFQTGAMVAFGTAVATATFVDGSTLQAIAPALSSGTLRVTVTNPDGKQYSFDDLFAVQ